MIPEIFFTAAVLVAIVLVKLGVDKIKWAFQRGCSPIKVSNEWITNNDLEDK